MKLYRQYDFENYQQLFDYCVESYVNGQKKQAKSILQEFVWSADQDRIKQAVANSYQVYGDDLLQFLINAKDRLGSHIVSLTVIANSFFDHNRMNFAQVKDYLMQHTGEVDI